MKPGQMSSSKQTQNDTLMVIAAFHYAVGGITALFSLLILIARTRSFIRDDLVFGIAGLVVTTIICLSGFHISKAKNRQFSLFTAALLCFIFPFGTVLGITTLIYLTKDSIKALYQKTDCATWHN
jgi:hypothetical protein